MLWLKIAIIITALAAIIFSIPKLKSKYQASSQRAQERIALFVPLVLAILGAIVLIDIVR